MQNMRYLVFLIILLAGPCMAAEPDDYFKIIVPHGKAVRTLPGLKVDCAHEGHLVLVMFNWYRAEACTALHRNLGPREQRIKKKIASTFPAFHALILSPENAAKGKELNASSPYQSGKDPFLDEDGCSMVLLNVESAIMDERISNVIMQCWEMPNT